MPTVEVVFDDLQRLVGKSLPKDIDALNQILSYVKGEVESFEEQVKIEIKDGNRPDLWTVEGIARELRGVLGVEDGLKDYSVEEYSGVEVQVDPKLKDIRPYIGAAVVKGVELDSDAIRGLVNLQDKLDQTYGRRRRRASIGLYNFDLIKPPLRYSAVKPTEVSFVPLNFSERMNLEEILEKHPKGAEYGYIVKKHPYWPAFLDSKDQVLSFPPIINSDDLGRVTEDVENVLVEVTGTSQQTLMNTLTIVTLSLADRGGKIYSTKILYPYGKTKVVVTPKFEKRTMKMPTKIFSDILGLDLSHEKVVRDLKKARYGVSKATQGSIDVILPCYRVDIMHPVDIVEDVGIMHGYSKIKPRWPQLVTVGEVSLREVRSDLVREIMTGLGFQEILTFSMSNRERLFDKMAIEEKLVVEVSNPKTLTYTCLRNWLMPNLIEFLSNNTHIEYPQRVFEVGDCVVFDDKAETGTKDVRKLACATVHPTANFSETKAFLDALLLNLGLKYSLKETSHGSFIEGRAGEILVKGSSIGIIGEISPSVLEEWKLGNPVAGFELDLDKLFEI
jgi:phenylalanyl-tRNA synthetase beta chain